MRKKAILGIILLFFCLFAPNNAQAQMPFVLGAVLETGSGLIGANDYGTGIVRVTPFAGIWLHGLGFARVGINMGSRKVSSNGTSEEDERFDISAQIGFSPIGPEHPYITASYTRSEAYSASSDFEWNEWGLGIGHRFSLSPFAGIVAEAEHRWITKHPDRLQNSKISGRRLQMNLGFVAHIL